MSHLVVTSREHQLWKLLAIGLRQKEAADQMGVCRQTVDKHRDNLYRKIGCTSVVEATLLAVAYGVISVAPMGPLVVRRTKAATKGNAPCVS